jgi:hypothetical protein
MRLLAILLAFSIMLAAGTAYAQAPAAAQPAPSTQKPAAPAPTAPAAQKPAAPAQPPPKFQDGLK